MSELLSDPVVTAAFGFAIGAILSTILTQIVMLSAAKQVTNEQAQEIQRLKQLVGEE